MKAIYLTKDPDFVKHMALRQRLNLAIMRAIEARGLAFAFPTQTVHTVISQEKKEDETGLNKGVATRGPS